MKSIVKVQKTNTSTISCNYKYRKEFAVYGWCRQYCNNIDINIIPKAILQVIITWYSVNLEQIKFVVHYKPDFEMNEDCTEFKAKIYRYDPVAIKNRMVSANIGYNEGYHE